MGHRIAWNAEAAETAEKTGARKFSACAAGSAFHASYDRLRPCTCSASTPGGTKTVCLLADERGVILSEGRGPGANLHAAGELAVENVLRDLIAEAIGDRAIVPAAICLGIAGVDREDEMRTVRAIMRRIGHASRVLSSTTR